MNTKTLVYVGAALLAAWFAWRFFVSPTPPPNLDDLDVPPPAVTEPADKPAAGTPDTSKPTPPTSSTNCAEIIKKYERLKFEKEVLGNDYITPSLEMAYRRCT